jgi:hypothetical protein
MKATFRCRSSEVANKQETLWNTSCRDEEIENVVGRSKLEFGKLDDEQQSKPESSDIGAKCSWKPTCMTRDCATASVRRRAFRTLNVLSVSWHE